MFVDRLIPEVFPRYLRVPSNGKVESVDHFSEYPSLSHTETLVQLVGGAVTCVDAIVVWQTTLW